MQTDFGRFMISDDRAIIDAEAVCRLLSDTYWAADRPREKTLKAMENSICISVFLEKQQIGFARVVTDKAVFSWIADVVVDRRYRSQGIGKAIIRFIQDHPDIPDSIQLLRTRDAHGLYAQFGFQTGECMSK